MRRPARENPFLRDFKTYCERNRNSGGCHAAYWDMLRDFRSGDKAFSFGTWRDIWRAQHPYEAVPAACPPNWVPRGFSYSMMMAHAKNGKGRDLSLRWNRQGMFAASKHLPPVIRSRAVLHPGEVYQSDDVWHNIDVYAPGIKGTFQPLEFATYDVASAFKIGSLMKPRKMSRREAWAAGQSDLVKWPLFDACAFLDPGDGKRPGDQRRATVGQDGTISFTDSVYFPGERKIYLAQYRDRNGTPHSLRAGEEVWFYWCPTLPLQIWITDASGQENFGMAPALKTAAWADPESVKVAVGQRQHQIAELMADTRARHAESAVARLAAQGVNRALIAAAKEAKAAGAAPDGEGYSFDELAEADNDFSPADSTPCGRGSEAAGEEAFSLDELASV